MKAHKRMLIELPTADEVDALAMSTPELSVRKFEYDMKGGAADLDYAPCKGRMVLVIRGEKGTALVPRDGDEGWALPSGHINTYEDIADSARRVAKESCGLSLRSMDLAAIYDVVWHYEDVTIKRLHIVYAAVTDDTECRGASGGSGRDPGFHKDVQGTMLGDELDRAALDDCAAK